MVEKRQGKTSFCGKLLVEKERSRLEGLKLALGLKEPCRSFMWYVANRIELTTLLLKLTICQFSPWSNFLQYQQLYALNVFWSMQPLCKQVCAHIRCGTIFICYFFANHLLFDIVVADVNVFCFVVMNQSFYECNACLIVSEDLHC